MTPMLSGFVDELCKLAAAESPQPISEPKPIAPMRPPGAPQFKPPPGLRKIKMPPTTLRKPQMPALTPRTPKVWQTPGVNR